MGEAGLANPTVAGQRQDRGRGGGSDEHSRGLLFTFDGTTLDRPELRRSRGAHTPRGCLEELRVHDYTMPTTAGRQWA